MSTINKVILIGHLGDDIKMHYFEGGGCIGRAPLATNESWKDKQTNEKKTRTDWHNVVFRNKGAELMEKYTKKGDKVYIEGQLRTREWEDENGQKRYSTEVNVRDFKFMQTKGESGPTAESLTSQQNAESSKPPANTPDPKEEDHDDLPF